MNLYESLFIINPALDETEVGNIVGKVEELIKKGGGEVVKVDNWGKKKLAYEVKKQKKGYYILINFRIKPGAISELERTLKITDPIIKFLIIRIDESALTAQSQVQGEPHEVAAGSKEEE